MRPTATRSAGHACPSSTWPAWASFPPTGPSVSTAGTSGTSNRSLSPWIDVWERLIAESKQWRHLRATDKWERIEGAPWPLGESWVESERAYNFALFSAMPVALRRFSTRRTILPDRSTTVFLILASTRPVSYGIVEYRRKSFRRAPLARIPGRWATDPPALEFARTKPGCSIVSSVFFMCLPDRVLVYGDCAINPDPDCRAVR